MEMTREKAVDLVRENIDEDNLVKHCLAVEGVMRRLARYFDREEEKWALTGLLHDIDYSETKDDEEAHSQLGADMLADMGMPDDVVEAVRAHNHAHGLPRETLLAKALYASDPLTGLIVAATLVHPEQKLAEVDTDFVLNRYEESSFARGADRDVIASCTEMDLELDEFVSLALEGMQNISEELGL